MELKKRRWSCRYVCEYLAIGEAPTQIRNCFQQRSRWTKVGLPLLQGYLSLLASPCSACSLLHVHSWLAPGLAILPPEPRELGVSSAKPWLTHS